MQYSFTLAPKCPHCGMPLDAPGSVQMNERSLFVLDDGLLSEDGGDFILTTDNIEPTCLHCNNLLEYTANEES